MTEENKALTLFEAVTDEHRQKAIEHLLKGTTPAGDIRRRPARGGDEVPFVNIYYMTRQISLITGFRWSSECLEEKFYPSEDPATVREIGAKMRVTIWDANGNQYSHISWGQKDVARYTKDDKYGKYKAGDIITIFDDMKAAYSDGIKKCLSYFGIANDVYGSKELEPFADDGAELSIKDGHRLFGEFLGKNRILVSKACEILGIKSLSEVTDYKEAHDKLVAWKKGGGESTKPVQPSTNTEGGD